MSFRDITHNPNLIRALRELAKKGVYGQLEKVRDNYGIILVDVEKTGEYLMKENKERWVEPYYDQENRTIVFHINIPEYAAIPQPKEERDRIAKDLQDKFRRRGIRTYIELPKDNEGYITLDLDSIALYIKKLFEPYVRGKTSYYFYYDKDNAVLQLHAWTGMTPKEVQKLKQEVSNK